VVLARARAVLAELPPPSADELRPEIGLEDRSGHALDALCAARSSDVQPWSAKLDCT
jgi:hypothetical protein